MEKHDFIELFRYNHWLLRHDSGIMRDFEVYRKAVGQLRSDSIRDLRLRGIPGYIRAAFNLELERHIYVSYTDYLWFKTKQCGLCNGVIQDLSEVTCDHIVPTWLGGQNTMSNKQISHAHCNNKLKNGRVISSLNNYVLYYN